MNVLDSLVIGAGQAGLSSSFHLKRLGIDHVVLDAERSPGGAWQHRWDSLTMKDVHGVADLPDAVAPTSSGMKANTAIPEWFSHYERDHELPVIRPVQVDSVRDRDGTLVVAAGDREWRTRTLINATGTWRRPFIPFYPGQDQFAGAQFHTVDYPGREQFVGKRVVVVGAGASAIQFIGEIATVAEVTWVSRRAPHWLDDDDSLRNLLRRVHEHVIAGNPPHSAPGRSVAMLREQEREAEGAGIYDRRRPMFRSIERTGVRWADGSFVEADMILWATGFRHDLEHLAPLHLRSPSGGIALVPGTVDPQASVTSVCDRRVQMVGYGPSASTIGGNRAGRAAALAVRAHLAET